MAPAGRAAVALALAGLALVPACGRRAEPGPPIELSLRVSPDLPVVGTSRLEFDLRDPARRPLSGARVTVEGNMSHPGMVPSFAAAREVGPGTYRADLDLTMAGDWVLEVEVRLASGGTARRTLALPRVGNR